MTEIDRTKVCVLIPALNEKRTIGDVIKGIQSQGYHNILVVDGHSTDGTTDIAESLGAKVYIQKAKGKGAAMQEAFALIKEPYILMLDADGTNPPEFADAMVEPLTSGRADHVIGNRLESYEKGALTKLNHFGNIVMNRLFKWAHGVFMTDILSGYRAFTKESVEKMHLTESGFGIETEISSEVVHHNLRFEVVPTYYKKRTGAPTKLKPISDGWKILVAINILLLIALQIFGEDDGTGNKAWIRFLGIGIQPSEIVKVIFCRCASHSITVIENCRGGECQTIYIFAVIILAGNISQEFIIIATVLFAPRKRKVRAIRATNVNHFWITDSYISISISKYIFAEGTCIAVTKSVFPYGFNAELDLALWFFYVFVACCESKCNEQEQYVV